MERKGHSCAGTGRRGGHWVTMKSQLIHPAECMAVTHASLCWGVGEGVKETGPTDHLASKGKWDQVWADGSIASCEREEE